MRMFTTMMSLHGASLGIGSYTVFDSAMNSNLIGVCMGFLIMIVSNINFIYWLRGEKRT